MMRGEDNHPYFQEQMNRGKKMLILDSSLEVKGSELDEFLSTW